MRTQAGHRAMSEKCPTTGSCTGKQRVRQSDAEGLRRFEIDDQLDFSRLYNRQVGGLSAFEDFVRVKSNL
jgi:hypothetical protein